MPAAFAKASALMMFMPQPASTPEIVANSAGRSAVSKVREKAWLARLQLGLHRLGAQFLVQREMRGDLRGGVHCQIAPRESFEEPLDLRLCSRRRLARAPVRAAILRRSVQAIAIQSAAEVVRGRHEKLPQHFRFPRRQGFRIHGVNVGVGQQAQPLQALLSSPPWSANAETVAGSKMSRRCMVADMSR